MIREFGLHCVRTGLVEKDLASHLGELETARLTADYEGDVPDADAAATALLLAEDFVIGVRDEFLPEFDVQAEKDSANIGEPQVTSASGPSS